MDLFFGAAKRMAKEQQTASIRVEERVVRRTGKGSTGSGSRAPKAPGLGTAQSPGARELNLETEASLRGKRSLMADSNRQARRQAAASQAASITDSVGLSAKDRGIVNANRERVGSLPGSPRPRKALARAGRSRSPKRLAPQPRPRQHRPAPASPEHSIERSSSVPAQASGKARRGGGGMAGAAAPPPGDQEGGKLDASDDDEGGGDDDNVGAAAIVHSDDAIKQSETQYESYFT
ncbi:hypothetical protein GGI04_005124, partial [Coemansia thaxteri]